MENFVVSARKYRPATFDTVVGQEHITTTLKNAIKSSHLAQAFLFCGPRGVGKTTCARILAKTINCMNLKAEIEACNECDSCRAFNGNASFNIHELDAASNNSVDDIRSLVEQVRYAPQQGKYKIYIIDEVHMLSVAAFNAFLKTLEEPPSYAIFILATTERHKIIPTILSRCQTFDFNRIQVKDIMGHLAHIAQKEHVEAEPDALHLIGQKADGALRDALSIFDQMVTFSGNTLTYKDVVNNLHILDYDYYFRMTDHLLDTELSNALLLFDEIIRLGFDAHNFVVGLAEHLRGLLVSKDNVTIQLLQVSEGIQQRYQQQANRSPLSFLLSGLNILSQCDIHYKASKNQRLHVELALMKLAHLKHALHLSTDQAPPGLLTAPNGQPVLNGSKKASATSPAVASSVESGTQPTSPSSVAEPHSAGYAQDPYAPKPTETLPPTFAEETTEELAEAALGGTVESSQLIAPPAMMPEMPHVTHQVTVPVLEPVRKTGGLPSLKSIPKLDLRQLQANAEKAAPLVVEEEPGETGPVSPIDASKLQHVWNEYAERRHHDGHVDHFMILNRPISVNEEGLITLELDSSLQELPFNAFRDDLLHEIRHKMGNNRLRVQLNIKEQTSERKLYTMQDKFNYLVEKHPLLTQLKDRLQLDMNF